MYTLWMIIIGIYTILCKLLIEYSILLWSVCDIRVTHDLDFTTLVHTYGPTICLSFGVLAILCVLDQCVGCARIDLCFGLFCMFLCSGCVCASWVSTLLLFSLSGSLHGLALPTPWVCSVFSFLPFPVFQWSAMTGRFRVCASLPLACYAFSTITLCCVQLH